MTNLFAACSFSPHDLHHHAQHAAPAITCQVAGLSIRVCGGQAMLKDLALERMSHAWCHGKVMLPRSGGVCLDRLGKACLYPE